MNVDTALVPESSFADLNTVIRDTCNRFSRITGWTLTFQPAEDELADFLEQRLHEDESCFWHSRVCSGYGTLGLMSIGRGRSNGPGPAENGSPRLRSRLRRASFPLPEACDAAEVVVRLLNQIATRAQVLELSDANRSGMHAKFDRNAQRRLDVLRFLSGYDAVAVFVAEEQVLNLVATSGLEPEQIPVNRRSLENESTDQQAIDSGRSVVVSRGRLLPAGFHHAVCLPLDRRSKDLGTVWFYSCRSDRPSDSIRQAQSLAGRFAGTFDDLAVQRIAADNSEMRRELRQLARIQKAAEHESPPADEQLDYSWHSAGHSEVNGDLCEYLSLDEHRTFVAVGDACGHGLPAAVITTTVRGCLRCLIQLDNHPSPGEILGILGNALTTTTPTYMFMTLLLGVVDTKEKTFRYASAGHPSPVVMRTDGSFGMLDGSGLLLGVMEGAEYQDRETPFEPGDVIVGFSDGITEARSESDVMFNVDGIRDAIRETDSETESATLVQLIISAVRSHSGSELPDDASVVVLRHRPVAQQIDVSSESQDAVQV